MENKKSNVGKYIKFGMAVIMGLMSVKDGGKQIQKALETFKKS